MIRRWIIRFLAMLPFLICVTGWGLSFLSDSELSCFYRGHGGGVISTSGYLTIIVGRAYGLPWYSSFRWHPFEFYKERTTFSEYHRVSLGSGYAHQINKPDDILILAIPYWFPTTIIAALLWLVWRKTRPPVKGRAFPVEVKPAS